MTKTLSRILGLLLALALLTQWVPAAAAVPIESDRCPDLSQLIRDDQRRQFVEMMVSYYLRHDPAVRSSLRSGYSSVFFFEGCSDNMNHPELRDISYYRVSAVCLLIRLDEDGQPVVAYFSDACSTLPDRPLDFAPRKEEVPADVGPATVLDGTYELYSVRHGGAYEALHVRTSFDDATVPALYMTPHGYTQVQATMINVHTRTDNHVLKYSMWSEGCLLVGDGEFWKFSELMASAYYSIYPYFALGVRVGSITINRQFLRQEMYSLYGDREPVDLLLTASTPMLPQSYLDQCRALSLPPEDTALWTARDTQLMTLPCSGETDARSVTAYEIAADTQMEILGCLGNTRGAIWYEVEHNGVRCYLYSGDTREPGWFEQLWHEMTE